MASGSASVADLFTCCCILPLAANDAEFTSHLLLGFGSDSIGLSLESRAGDANVGAGAAVVTLLLLSFLCSPLCTSSANVSLITSLLRSYLYAPCGVILRHSSLRTLQRSEWVCALALSLVALQPKHPIVAPNSSMPCLVILSLWIRALSHGNGRNWDRVHSTFWSVHCPSAVCQSPKCEGCLVVRSGHGPQAEVAQGVGPQPLVEL